jgi:hypothetical protein
MEYCKCNSYFESRWIDAVSSRLKESLEVCVGVLLWAACYQEDKWSLHKKSRGAKFRKLSFVYRIFRILGKDAISGIEKEVPDSKLL